MKSHLLKWVGVGMLGALVPAATGVLMTGCQKSVPPASVLAVPPCPPPYELNSCQSLTNDAALSVNGNWNTAGMAYISTLSLSKFYVTYGTYSLDVAITGTATGYTNNWLTLSLATPVSWRNYPEMILDLTADKSIVQGSTYSTLSLIGSNGTSTGGYSPMSTNSPLISKGYQSVTLDIDLSNSQSTIPVTQDTSISLLYFIYNRNSPSGPGQEMGNIYIDNIRLISSCP